MTKIVCWNIRRSHTAWQSLPDSHGDIALLQEAGSPPENLAGKIDVDPAAFRDTEGKAISRTAIVKLSDEVSVEWLEPVPLPEAQPGDFVISQPGCISAAIVSPIDAVPFIVASISAEYQKPHRSTGKMSWDIVDASVHRVISDLSLLIGKQREHRILAAGDLSVLHGYGENDYWRKRYDTVFARMEALGLPFVGPQHPNGRRADPWPDELPRDSLNVPTYYHSTQEPATATRQLDFVFASKSMKDSVMVRALNHPDEWGPSDHSRLEIIVQS